MTELAELRDLLNRAMADLRVGWPEAAYDAIGRALRLAEQMSEHPEAAS